MTHLNFMVGPCPHVVHPSHSLSINYKWLNCMSTVLELKYVQSIQYKNVKRLVIYQNILLTVPAI